MANTRSKAAHDLYRKLKWLIFFRALFGGVLLGSVVIATLRPDTDMLMLGLPLIYLHGVAVGLLVFSLAYALVLRRIRRLELFAYIQTAIDTCFVTLVIFITGSFASIFSFLYLVVIIYATMVIYRRGGMIIATFCSIQYGVMIDLEFFGLIRPPGLGAGDLAFSHDWTYVIYKLVITIGACYGVAFLSGFLAEQERRAKRELWAMEDQMKRVERLAAVGEMAAGLAHEIKNPLASLTGSVQMLRETSTYDAYQDKLMQIVLREADRLSSLVTDFLMFARPHKGKARKIQLDRAVEEIVSLFQNDPAHNGRVAVHKSLEKHLWVDIDPEHLKQVIWNLLNNAAESITETGRVEISLYPFKKSHACIAIEDNGCGISDQQLDSVFDPFFSTKPKGTGLGLSIAQQIIGAYGGLIDIQSKPGEGTRVVLKLQRCQPA